MLDLLISHRLLTRAANHICLAYLDEKWLSLTISDQSTCDSVVDLTCEEASTVIEELIFPNETSTDRDLYSVLLILG